MLALSGTEQPLPPGNHVAFAARASVNPDERLVGARAPDTAVPLGDFSLNGVIYYGAKMMVAPKTFVGKDQELTGWRWDSVSSWIVSESLRLSASAWGRGGHGGPHPRCALAELAVCLGPGGTELPRGRSTCSRCSARRARRRVFASPCRRYWRRSPPTSARRP
jgi:hypothetical protein